MRKLVMSIADRARKMVRVGTSQNAAKLVNAAPCHMRPTYNQQLIRSLTERFDRGEITGPEMNFAATALRDGIKVRPDLIPAHPGHPLDYRILHWLLTRGPSLKTDLVQVFGDVDETLEKLVQKGEIENNDYTTAAVTLYWIVEDSLEVAPTSET